MAKIGLSKPRAAVYNASGSDVTYGDGFLLGKYTAFNLSVESNSDNDLYADNAVAESDPSFSGGTATLTTDDLSADIMATVLGLSSETISTSVTTASASWMLWDDTQMIPYLGIGGVIKRIQSGVTKWQGFVLPKVKLVNPALALETQGQTISWQTQELTADIERSDEPNHRWFMMTTELPTEGEADAAVAAFLTATTASTP